MKILIVDTFYGPYLERLYASGELIQQLWPAQHKAHFAGGFGTGDAYSHGLGLLGVEAIEIVANSIPLQRAWAQEHRPDLLQLQDQGQQLLAILDAQIRWFEATVLYVQDINWLPPAFIEALKASIQLIVVGQNACPLSPNQDLKSYDLILTSLPSYVALFKNIGVSAAYFPIGFDERLLLHHQTTGPRPNLLTFVGGLGGFHSNGTQVLESIARELPLDVWGYGAERLPDDSMLKYRWKGEAWAGEMYGLLASSQITVNRHIDIADTYACNMRLYEATGMCACLVTEHRSNITDLFEPDNEVITFSSTDEAIAKIKELIDNPSLAVKIARNGQLRTLEDHTYSLRMQMLLDILSQNIRSFGKSNLFNCHTPKSEKISIPVYSSSNFFPSAKSWADQVRLNLGSEKVSFCFIVDGKVDALGEKVWMPSSPQSSISSLIESFFNCNILSGFAVIFGLRANTCDNMQNIFLNSAQSKHLLVRFLMF